VSVRKQGLLSVVRVERAGRREVAGRGGQVRRGEDAREPRVAVPVERATTAACSKADDGVVQRVAATADTGANRSGYGVSVPVPSNIWHRLRVDFKGTRFTASFNGRQMFEVEDSTFPDAGKVGLWTKADSVTLFDEVSCDETR